jgi:hypothetical protein
MHPTDDELAVPPDVLALWLRQVRLQLGAEWSVLVDTTSTAARLFVVDLVVGRDPWDPARDRAAHPAMLGEKPKPEVTAVP